MSTPFKSFEAFALLVGDIAKDIQDCFVLENPTHYEFTDKQNWTLFFPQHVSVRSWLFKGSVHLVLNFYGKHRTNVVLPRNDMWDAWNEMVGVHRRALTGVDQLKSVLGESELKWDTSIARYKNLDVYCWDRDRFGFSVDLRDPGKYTAAEVVAKIKDFVASNPK